MRVVDRDFVNYITINHGDKIDAAFLAAIVEGFQNEPVCSECRSNEVGYVVDLKAILKCKNCNGYTDTGIENIPESKFADVVILHKDIMEKLMEAQNG